MKLHEVMTEDMLHLLRVRYNVAGTWGVVEHLYQPFALSLELPWLDNQRNISCIPTGKYKIIRQVSPSRGLVYALQSVPGRSNVLMHVGNTKKNTKGCQLIGEEFGYLKKKPAILCSRRGFSELMSKMKNFDVGWLIISDA